MYSKCWDTSSSSVYHHIRREEVDEAEHHLKTTDEPIPRELVLNTLFVIDSGLMSVVRSNSLVGNLNLKSRYSLKYESGIGDLSYIANTIADKESLIMSLIKTVARLHYQRLVHGALNPWNVVVNKDRKSVRVVGFSKCNPFTISLPRYGKGFISPELSMNDNAVAFASDDIWALGMTIEYILDGGGTYIDGNTQEEILERFFLKSGLYNEYKIQYPNYFTKTKDRPSPISNIEHNLNNVTKNAQLKNGILSCLRTRDNRPSNAIQLLCFITGKSIACKEFRYLQRYYNIHELANPIRSIPNLKYIISGVDEIYHKVYGEVSLLPDEILITYIGALVVFNSITRIDIRNVVGTVDRFKLDSVVDHIVMSLK